jgi:hypothetical protein
MRDPLGDEMLDADSAFTERIAAPLRTPVHLDANFDERVMMAVAAVARGGRAPRANSTTHWFLRPRNARFTPLSALAAAAGFAGLVLLGAEGLRNSVFRSTTEVPEASASVPDTVHLMRFVFLNEAAQSVFLVGDFNAWTNGATPLEARGEEGVWTVSVSLPPGRHEYAFIVNDQDGQHWVADPLAPVVRDEYDTESSFILLGRSSS